MNFSLQNKIIYLLIILITSISYFYFLKYTWFRFDDYFSIGLIGIDNFYNQWINGFMNLYEVQQRFQPVRHFFATLAWQFFDESNYKYISLIHHCFNLFLLFKFLKILNLTDQRAFIGVILFGIFGQERFTEMPVVMIGGIGLCTTFLLLSLIYYNKYLHTKKSFIFLIISVLCYSAYVFSYESSIPLLLVFPLFFLLIQKQRDKTLNNAKHLLLYTIPVIAYLIIFFAAIKSGQSEYTGAQINLKYIVPKTISYLNYSFVPHLRYSFEFIFFLVPIILSYYVGLLLLKNKHSNYTESISYQTLTFSFIFYLLSISVYVINNWLEPTSVMAHHSYLFHLTALIFTLLISFNIADSFNLKYRLLANNILSFILFPVLFVGMASYNLECYKHKKIEYEYKLNFKNFIQNHMEQDVSMLILNMPPHSYGFSDLSAGMNLWADFKNYYVTGDKIIDINNEDISFMGPISYYPNIKQPIKTNINDTNLFIIKKGDDWIEDKIIKIENYFDASKDPYLDKDVFLNTNIYQDICLNIKKTDCEEKTQSFFIKNEKNKTLTLEVTNKIDYIYINDKKVKSMNVKNNKIQILDKFSQKYLLIKLYNPQKTLTKAYFQ